MFLQRFAITSFACFAASACSAAERLDGPYRAQVERVVDGDTLAVRVTVWLGQEVNVLVRIRGIDAPELKGRCAAENVRALAARSALADMTGASVVLTAIEGDKYFGRVLATVATAGGDDVGGALLRAGLARPYDGGRRGSWCGVAKGGPGVSRDVADAARR